MDDTTRPVRTIDALLAFARDELELDLDQHTTSTPLFTSGLLDSFALVALLAYTEQHFGFELPVEAITADVLDTLDSLAGYIDSREL
jgi:acyl carrier protein